MSGDYPCGTGNTPCCRGRKRILCGSRKPRNGCEPYFWPRWNYPDDPKRLIIMIKMNQEIKKLKMMCQGMTLMVADAQRPVTLKANKYH